GRVEVPGGLRGELHHQDRADAEVRGDDAADLGGGAEHLADPVEPRLVEPGGAHDGVQAVVEAPGQVVHDHAGQREVHDHVHTGLDEPVERLVVVDRRGQFQVVGIGHGLADGGAHPAPRAQHTHFDHSNAPRSNGPTAAVVIGCDRISAATARTPSMVTASLRARSSSTLVNSPYRSSSRPSQSMREPESSIAMSTPTWYIFFPRRSSASVMPSFAIRANSAMTRSRTSRAFSGPHPA